MSYNHANQLICSHNMPVNQCKECVWTLPERVLRLEAALESALAQLTILSAAASLGRLGGMSKSPAKQAAAAANGRKGGRPAKTRTTPLPSPTIELVVRAKQKGGGLFIELPCCLAWQQAYNLLSDQELSDTERLVGYDCDGDRIVSCMPIEHSRECTAEV